MRVTSLLLLIDDDKDERSFIFFRGAILWLFEKDTRYAVVVAATNAKEVVASNLDEPGFDDVKRKVQADFSAANVDVSDHMFDSIIEKKLEEARAQVEAEAKA